MSRCDACRGDVTIEELVEHGTTGHAFGVQLCKGHVNEWLDREDQRAGHTGGESCPICYGERFAEEGDPLPAIICYGPTARPLP